MRVNENQQPKRQPQRQPDSKLRDPVVTREIVLPIDHDAYRRAVEDNGAFRALLEECHRRHPECFPPEFAEEGFRFKDFKESKKMAMRIRRITVGIENPRHWRVVPCDVLPYMAGHTSEVEKPLFLRKFNVPYWALGQVFGRDGNYYYRVERRMGMASIAGSLAGGDMGDAGAMVKGEQAPGPSSALPEDIACDEKHAKYVGAKAYVAMSAGGGCVLGAELCAGADKESLAGGYGVLKEEIACAAPGHQIRSINTDGFSSTTTALRAVYGVGVVFITCILHLFIGLRDGCKRKYRTEFEVVATGLWWCYEGATKRAFAQRWRSLIKWCTDNADWLPERLVGKLLRANENKMSSYKAWYDRPQGHRVSTAIDRVMGLLDRRLFAMRHLHGHFANSRLLIRAWAQLYNFAPWNPQTAKAHKARCPAEKLTGFRYRENWLENFRVASSMGGYRHTPKTA